MKQVVIVANGRLSKSFLQDIRKADYVVGVDRGAYWLARNSIVPHIAIGDFDSVNQQELRLIQRRVKQVKEHPKEKDFTDMELAIQHAISLRPQEVVIYGAIGSRVDHTIANVFLLERLGGIGVLRDANNEVRLVSGRVALQKSPHYSYVSILPMTETIDVTLVGFLYDASHTRIHRGQALGVSNEIRGDEATVEIHRGNALLIRSRG